MKYVKSFVYTICNPLKIGNKQSSACGCVQFSWYFKKEFSFKTPIQERYLPANTIRNQLEQNKLFFIFILFYILFSVDFSILELKYMKFFLLLLLIFNYNFTVSKDETNNLLSFLSFSSYEIRLDNKLWCPIILLISDWKQNIFTISVHVKYISNYIIKITDGKAASHYASRHCWVNQLIGLN